MRRAASIVLLGLFSFALIAPALETAAEQNVPACCRRGGKHRCTMAASPSGTGAAVSAVCPQYPRSTAAPPHFKTPGVRPAPALLSPIPDYAAGPVQAEALARASLVRTRQKRGPPETPESSN